MKAMEFKNIYRNESTHYYYVDTHSLVIDLIKKYAPHGRLRSILDAGCGTGLLGTKLQQLGRVIGIDISPIAIRYAKKRGVHSRRASIEKLPFSSNTFDVVTSVDVLYHTQVKHDATAISETLRVLKPGGVFILRVPAVSWLKRNHDTYVCAKKRYDKADLYQLLHCSGFEILYVSYVQGVLLFFAFGAIVFEKLFRRAHYSSDVFPLPAIVNATILFILKLERTIFRFVSLPVGLGLVAVAKKPIS